PPWRPLSSMLSAVRKNGRMVSPDTVASSFTNAEKSIAVILRAPHRRRHSTYRRPEFAANPLRTLPAPRHPAGEHCPPRLGRSKAAVTGNQSSVRAALSGTVIHVL